MLRRLGNIFRVPDLRNKVLFTIGVICLYQAGANIPIPGVSWSQVRLLQTKAGASGVLGFLNLFSGGALPGCRRSEENHADDALSPHRLGTLAVDRSHLRLPRSRRGAARLQHR